MPIKSRNFSSDGMGSQKFFTAGQVPLGNNTAARIPKQSFYTGGGEYLQQHPSTDKYAGAKSIHRTPDFFVNPRSEEHVGHIPVTQAHKMSSRTETLLLAGFVATLIVVIILNRK